MAGFVCRSTDLNGNGVWNAGVDRITSFGLSTDTPIIGDWAPAAAPLIAASGTAPLGSDVAAITEDAVAPLLSQAIDFWLARSLTQSQQEHHKTISFRDEYRPLLIRHGIAFDEQYLFQEEHVA